MMNNARSACLNLALLSATVVCFEILSTRISSVVFVNNYAFIILSLAVLGLGTGGIFSYYRIKAADPQGAFKTAAACLTGMGISLAAFIVGTIRLAITSPFIYFPLLFIPFFFAGMIYSLFFKTFAERGFQLYAADLAGAALGSGASLGIFHAFNAPNAVLFLSLCPFVSALSLARKRLNWVKAAACGSALLLSAAALVIFGHRPMIGEVPIGRFEEKDFYQVYPDLDRIGYKVVDSRWSLYGRSDLVEYGNQNVVKQLFVDGAAGTPMYRFSGDRQNPDPVLVGALMAQSTAVPFMFLRDHERNSMLVIGPGGGKEVLIGLLSGVDRITGVEVNPDFVGIVKKYSSFNGGIYTDFPDIQIQVKEGRHYIKKTDQRYDLIVMALPSTEQLQNIDHMAMSENYLLTVEAIQDYLKILTSEGRLIFTVHNRWELTRLVVTALSAFNKTGVGNLEALDHFVILAQNDAPTIVIKKNAFSRGEVAYIRNVAHSLPQGLPSVTYLPFHWEEVHDTAENRLLKIVKDGRVPLKQYIDQNRYDISPVHDDSPYFYKATRGVPTGHLRLLTVVAVLCLTAITAPFSRMRKEVGGKREKSLGYLLMVFVSIGAGFMILEVALFQKLVLYLGSPTISLSMLLGSLLVGMGTGSYFGGGICRGDTRKRLGVVSLSIVGAGAISFLLVPQILNGLSGFSQAVRSVACFLLIVPFGFLLGIPFPSAVYVLQQNRMEKVIPWMYGINGIMSVLGSVLAVVVSMRYGFTAAFFLGLSIYLAVFVIVRTLGTADPV